MKTIDATKHRFAPRRWLGLNVTVLLVVGLLSVPCLSGQTAVQSVVVIRAGELFDSESGRLLDHPQILIVGNRIESVAAGQSPVPAGSRVIDLGDSTLLPGFIDVHTHLTMNAGSGGYESLGTSAPRPARSPSCFRSADPTGTGR